MKAKETWLDEMELRLKRAYLDLEELDNDEGQRFLRQEIASHLDDVPGEGMRREYLLSLRDRFPALLKPGESDRQQFPAMDTPDRAAFSAAEIGVAEALSVLEKNWDTVGSDFQLLLKDRLGLGGSVSLEVDSKLAGAEDTAVITPEKEIASAELIRFLKMPEEVEIRSEHLQEAVLLLLKALAQVDALATQVFRQVGVTRDLGRMDLRKAMGNYLSGAEATEVEISAMIDETRRKVALIISSVAGLSASFSQAFSNRFHPKSIERAAGTGGLLRGKESACWKKYVAMAGDFQPEKIEKAVNDHLVKNLKRLNSD